MRDSSLFHTSSPGVVPHQFDVPSVAIDCYRTSATPPGIVVSTVEGFGDASPSLTDSVFTSMGSASNRLQTWVRKGHTVEADRMPFY
ncbi:uncharacterized protein ARMOST_06051 [Armillaria ostoyae]|uniref:Uncharacterized protein n=1 Tax=Armillaria ostoyae TaxID=47428 RepID=A0A284R1Y1_ARMOS|nr:uncharacterized protein ARMOST_06051 [Armillaria ostoyae]